MSTLNVTSIKGRSGSIPNFPDGANISGIATIGAGGIDVTGIVTTTGAIVAGDGVNVKSGNVHVGQGGAGSNNGELKIQAGASTGNDIIAFLNQAGSTRGNITYDTDNNFVLFNVNAGEKLRIGSSGQIGIGGANYGTSGQVLTSQGGSAAPTWAEAGGGAWEFVSSTSLGPDYGASTFNMTGFTTSYAQYKIVLNDVGFVGPVAKKLYGKFYIDGSLYGGPSQSTYAFSSTRNDWHNNHYAAGQYNKHEMQLMNGGAAQSWSGTITMPMQQNAVTSDITPYCNSEIQTFDYYSREGCKTGSANNTTTTGLQLYNGTDSVNFGNYGRISVYRLKFS